jgi:hypothetical protein
MFDPFGDYEVAGYLRNAAAEKDLDVVKAADAIRQIPLSAAQVYRYS